MVPHISTADSSNFANHKATTNETNDNNNKTMTNSEMELNGGSAAALQGEICILEEQQHLIHEDEHQSNIVFGSQLIDQNSATPYSDATKVRSISGLFFSWCDSKSGWKNKCKVQLISSYITWWVIPFSAIEFADAISLSSVVIS